MKKICLAFIATLLLTPIARADEGMWFLMFIERLNQRDMQKMGLQLTAQEIYSINNNSLKDAIVQFDGGCTASIISKDGLVLTNHHCGYGQIAEVSSPENNYLRDGFWAKTYQDEIKPQSLFVRFFVRMDNVTQRMLSVVNDKMTEKEREAALNREMAKIQKENDEGGKYVVSVRSFFQGNEFYYFVYQDFKDVRLVGTPPESIGKFGGDTDNWEWPRQTGDFSLFRVYTDKNGNAAEYSAENVPMKAKKHLAVSLKGVQEKDFAMILGYPGRTNRWVPSFWVDQNVTYAYPAWVEGSKTAMDAMKPFMNADDAVRLMYASKYAQIANYWKNRQGMIEALKTHKTAETKRSYEKKFAKWANKKKNRAEYGDVLKTMANYFEKTNVQSADNNYLVSLIRATDFVALPQAIARAFQNYEQMPDEQKKQLVSRMQNVLQIYKEKHIATEKAILADGLKLYATKAKNVPSEVKQIQTDYQGDFKKFANKAFETSVFGSEENFKTFLENPNPEVLKNDLLVQLSFALVNKYNHKSEEQIALQDSYEKAFRKFVKGMRVSKIGKTLYPDANSTLRLTYGTVRALPADKRNADASINNYTTFKSMVAKYKPNDPEFDMPKRMIEMYEAKDFGRYLDKDGTMHVNFLTDNDITGGNSGSPVMNGKGELIGLAFDGNIEAMAGDVIFDSKLQRTINVDIRYVLWVIDKFSGAKHIVDEMTIAE
ncbi:S46 family peptidase [Capnocytophaga cynodegmi]|uniref:S46 family peptidase n=1 Tax=Capnocytophaga cynodegmi TaxID=28189 RepID=UPI001EE345C4|nr:S46 family peptidase [Capnocytophaga cynodegmi]